MRKQLYTIAALSAFLVLSVTNTFAGDVDQDIKRLPSLLGSTNAGKEFFFSFPPCYVLSGSENALYVYVSCGVATRVTLEVEGRGFVRTQTSKPNNVIEFKIAPGVGQPFEKSPNSDPPPDQIYFQAAVHVYADYPLVVYGCTRFEFTSDAFLAVPTNGWGQKYIVSSMADMSAMYPGFRLPSETCIIAGYDQTVVNFTMGGGQGTDDLTASGMKTGDRRTMKMNRGDVWAISTTTNEGDVSGSLVTSNKPIGVCSGNQCANVPTATRACDFVAEMELPCETWGKELHVTPIFSRKFNSYVKIFASEDNTKIYRDGVNFGVIRKGGGDRAGIAYWYDRIDNGSPRPIIVSGDKPIGVTLFNTGQEDDQVPSDPFQMVLTPVEQYQKEIIWNTPGINGGFGFATNYVNLVYALDANGLIPGDLEFAVVNGVRNFTWVKVSTRFGATTGGKFSRKINGKDYACKTLVLPGDGCYKLRSKDGFAAYAYGFSNYDSYGTPTSVALANLQKFDTVAPEPTWTIKCDGSVSDGSVTDLPNDTSRSNLGMVYLDEEMTYNYELQVENFVPGLVATAKWKANVIDLSQDAMGYVHYIDRAGNDKVIELKYNAPNYNLVEASINFNDKIGGVAFKPNETGTATVTIKNRSNSTTAHITKLELVKGTSGFSLQIPAPGLPIIILPNAEATFGVLFRAPATGTSFMDSIRIGDDCINFVKTELKAHMGAPVIDVSDIDFGTNPVNNPKTDKFSIRNSGNAPLVVSAYKPNVLPEFAPQQFPATPIVPPLEILPGKSQQYEVIFTAKNPIAYADQIEFISDAATGDNICLLNGAGTEAEVIVTGFNWDPTRINKPHVVTGKITVQNVGNEGLTMKGVYGETGDTPDFSYNKNAFIGVSISAKGSPGDSKSFDVTFTPTSIGSKKLTVNIEFEGTTGKDSSSAILDGTGILGKLKTSDYNFGTTEVSNVSAPQRRQIEILNERYTSSDSVTITDLTINGIGAIAENTTTWGTEGFRYNKAALGLPRTLQPDEKLTFEAEFVASKDGINMNNADITTVSDAEANVKSMWTGSGFTKGIDVTGGSATTCVGTSAQILCVVSNTGSSDATVSGLSITGPNAAAFTFQDPTLANGFVVNATSFQNVVINFTPTQATTPYNAVFNVVREGVTKSVDLTGTGQQFTATAIQQFESRKQDLVGKLDAKSTEVGFDVVDHISLMQPLTSSNVTSFKVKLSWNPKMTVRVSKQADAIKATGICAGWTVSGVKTDVDGVAEFTVSGGTSILNGTGELATVLFNTYLPENQDGLKNGVNMMCTVEPSNQCAIVTVPDLSLAIEPGCASPIRILNFAEQPTGLSAPNPNPATEAGTDINFSVAFKSDTEISIFNHLGERVMTLFSGAPDGGSYTLRIPTGDLASGAYVVQMVSGDFKATKTLNVSH